MVLQVRSQELCLAIGLLDGGGHAVGAVVGADPFVAAGAVGADGDFSGDGFTFDDERAPAVDEEVVDLADAGCAVVLGLGGLDEAEVDEDLHIGVGGEGAVEVVRHLPLGFEAGAQAGIGGDGFIYGGLGERARFRTGS